MSRLDVVNGYRPSEAFCFFSANIYTRQSSEANNIGQAFKNVYAEHVVNPESQNQLLPVGARGELLIQGPILSRGYFKDAEKTAKVFTENPS
jgi:non-ribosomal peptide synthetase component F